MRMYVTQEQISVLEHYLLGGDASLFDCGSHTGNTEARKDTVSEAAAIPFLSHSVAAWFSQCRYHCNGRCPILPC